MNVAIIGSGINSLCAAVTLSQNGHRVSVYEKNEWLGGNIQTTELDRPGFKHERFSGFWPLFTTGGFYQEYRELLEEYGLEFLNTEYTAGVLLPDGRAAVLRDDREKTAAALDRIAPGEGEAYRQVMKKFDKHAPLVFGLLGKQLWGTSGAGLAAKGIWQLGTEGMLEFFGEALPSGRKWLDNTFRDDLTKALIAPWALHTGLGPDDQASSLMLRVILASLEQTGMPVPKGGGSEVVRVLTEIVTDRGGSFHTGHTVKKILVDGETVSGLRVNGREVEAEVVLANVTPTALYQELLPPEAVPASVREDAGNYRYGRGNMQIHYGLDAPPAWPDPDLLKAGMVHVTPGLNAVSRSVNAALNGLLPARPTVVVGQHCAVDASRAPAGKWTLWIQMQECPNYPTGDELGEIDCSAGEWTPEVTRAYADRVEGILADHLPGFRDLILERNVISPAELSRINPKLVGGDPYSGAASLDQFLFWRPLPELRNHDTPVRGLYQIGAATHPGPGLNGTSGWLVARGV